MAVNADEIISQKHLRAWTQRGGPKPGNPVRYAGKNDEYLSIDSGDNPVRGGITPAYVHDPQRRNAYRLIGSSVDTPDLPSASVTFRQKHGALSWVRGDLSCPVNFYELAGTCTRPDSFLTGWSDMITIYSQGLATDRSGNNRVAFDGDDFAEDEIGFSFSAIYDIGQLTFGANAEATIARAVIDVAYGGGVECGACGPANNGAKWIYALQQSDGTATAANVVYSTDGGATWNTSTITGLGAAVLVDAIDVAGNTLIVASSADTAYYVTELNARTGAPGAWTKVTAGFVASSGPTDIYVAGASEVYFTGLIGNIYKATNLYGGVSVVATPAATDLTRIHGIDDTLVVVGASNVVYISTNRGRTWAAPVAGLTGSFTAVFVLDAYQYWVGDDAGVVSYTEDGGASWDTITMPGGATTAITDIVFATNEVGYITGEVGAAASLYTTYNGGQDWIGASSPRLPVVGTYTTLARIAIPASSDPMTVANTLAIAGTDGGGTDGILLTGAANVLG
jgi:photosystem II stability/assembly factor-like uncharacterized protein